MRPVIGITTYVEPATWGVWHELPTTLVPHDYDAAVTQAGGRAVLIPPDDLDADVLRVLDGLVLSGGADLGPELYGAEPGPLTISRPDRDSGEMLLARAALARDLPILGVCRGMQLLTVAAGGTLHQHLPDVLGHERHRPAPGVYGMHEARFTEGSRIAGLMGEDTRVHCFHHQGVDDPGSLTITGRAEDGTPEAVEDPARRFVLGVQWHPEVTRDKRLFGALVAAAGG
ncbi:gamma-glutamyl-gamma-aminobutyrate hydrolase family protein [Amorphoplanes digitatis]|uniref:Putative glutamine amidotransferase n=1 Tax=Actinoplanes digitatis TaxID=1868 RepID=A0A7W7HTD9_9ACTN|nr:gamma-glutamyl-gamma-aminobutyrate hydrolase family protein [Actinoplanes digitatis]MBB4760411.1 putative glutamine amidotransferase [Actinoplanes digitatis]BFE68546.1 gamma-glutamyl-gamma-aminobutyrate hydrolase family protein [Actinoplanes digitatis]GID95369.1 gamma-glutamyl-gamma-aminobutyrate hydrolase [Actinoplanes digitatis]